jgi:enamine deaminase RidA (YjgF/YER057c/UK114 family)
MRFRNFFALATAISLVLSVNVSAAKKKKKKDEEPVTQTLPVLKDPPLAVVADTDRLSFRVAPLSGKGLLSAQVRESLKVLMRDNKGAIVKVRAFVAGTGDMRRVGTIVSEMFTEKKLALPAVTTLQAGALPMDGAQVVIESVAAEKKPVNPHGIVLMRVMTLEQINHALSSLGLSGSRVLRATCYLPSIEGHTDARTAVVAAFPQASVNIVQMQRLPVRGPMICEAVAALERSPSAPVDSREGMAVVSAPRLVLTGTQLAFHAKDGDIRLAFERLGKTLESMNTGYGKVVYANLYPLAEDVAEKVRAHQGEFFTGDHPPVLSFIPMEGLPSLDASFAVEAVAIPAS